MGKIETIGQIGLLVFFVGMIISTVLTIMKMQAKDDMHKTQTQMGKINAEEQALRLKLLSQGYSPEEIAEMSGYSPEEIANAKRQLSMSNEAYNSGYDYTSGEQR